MRFVRLDAKHLASTHACQHIFHIAIKCNFHCSNLEVHVRKGEAGETGLLWLTPADLAKATEMPQRR
jgi:hypothetical protein